MYENAKQAETECKRVGSYAWTNMLAATGQAVQLAVKELDTIVRGNDPYLSTDNRDSAFARAKSNRDDAYAVLNEIHNHAADIHESELELTATRAAKEQNTTKEKILKAMLKREHVRKTSTPYSATQSAVKSSKPWMNYGPRRLPRF